MANNPAHTTEVVPVELPTLTSVNGHGRTTSLQVAKHFRKRHDNVLRAIRELGCSEKFSLLNFEEREFVDERGKSQPMVEMTRDGFSILVMRFTGPQAMAWKEQYIQAFNQLEQVYIEQIKGQAQQALSDHDFRQTLSWRQRLEAFDDMHRARAELDREPDPAHRVIRWQKLAFVSRVLGYEPDPLDSMPAPLLLGRSQRQQDDSETIAELINMRDHLLRSLIDLNTAAEPLLFPVDMEEMPPVVRAARKAISMGLAQKGGAA